MIYYNLNLAFIAAFPLKKMILTRRHYISLPGQNHGFL